MKDGNGYLTIDELKDFLSPERLKIKQTADNSGKTSEENENQMWQELMNEVDSNNDGKVNLYTVYLVFNFYDRFQ